MINFLSMETLKRSLSVYLIRRRGGEFTSMNPFPRKKRVDTKKCFDLGEKVIMNYMKQWANI